MYFDPKSPAYLSTQESPSFVGIQTPGLRSPSLFINDKGYGPSSVTSPEKKLVAKSDMIYISKTQLENELHHFVATLVQQKSVNENDTLYYLDQLKNSVLNLIKENTRLQQTPQSARGGLSSQHSPREERLVNQKDEDMLNQKNFYEEKIHANSLHIAKLEQKINDLVLQSQGLMRINHELSTQMLQLSQAPHPAHPTREESEQMSSNRSDRLREINMELENNLNFLKNENQKLHTILEKNRFDLENIHKERDILKFELTKAFQQLKEQAESNNQESQEFYPRAKDLNQKANSNNEIETQSFGTGDLTKSQTKENIELKHIDLMKKQLSDYKAANAILHKKTEKYLLQIEDLNEALKLTNYNLEVLQNRYITLEKELVNKNRLEAIMSSYMNVISKLEVKIQSITEENAILQKVNEENIIVISELKSQLEQPNEGGKQEECESPFFATPDTKRKVINDSTQADHSGRLTLGNQSATKAPETVLLEQELTKKKFEEKVENVLHEKELEMRAERIKHKNQIEKYNSNLEVLSKKIQALVTVNEGLAKDLEILKIEFSNYRTISWSVIQEVRVHLDSFKKHDFEISKGLSEIEAGNGRGLEKLKQAYGELRRDVMNADEVIEERRKFL